jgi:hypothetical protein
VLLATPRAASMPSMFDGGDVFLSDNARGAFDGRERRVPERANEADRTARRAAAATARTLMARRVCVYGVLGDGVSREPRVYFGTGSDVRAG